MPEAQRRRFLAVAQPSIPCDPFHGFRRLFNLGFKARLRCVSCDLARSYFGEFQVWALLSSTVAVAECASTHSKYLPGDETDRNATSEGYRAMGTPPRPTYRCSFCPRLLMAMDTSVGTYVGRPLLLVPFASPPSTSDPGWTSYLRRRGWKLDDFTRC